MNNKLTITLFFTIYVLSSINNINADVLVSPYSSTCANDTWVPSIMTNQSNGDAIVVTFLSSARYYTTTYDILDADSSCQYTANSSYWNTTISGCTVTFNFIVPLNMITTCGWSQQTETVDAISRTAVFKMNAIEDAGTLRNMRFNKTTQYGFLLQIVFSKFVNATSEPISVVNPYGAVEVVALLTDQLFNAYTYTATFTFVTSTSIPYRLQNATFTSVAGWTHNITSVDGYNCYQENITNYNTSCFQYWTIVMRRDDNCNPGPTTLAHTGWLLSFDVYCRSRYSFCTDTRSNYTLTLNDTSGVSYNTTIYSIITVNVTFDTDSNNYCPTVLGSYEPAATLTPYDGYNGIVQSTFVWGATNYFRAVVTSPVDMSQLRIEKIMILSGGYSSNQELYNAMYSNGTLDAYFSQTPADSNFNTQPVSGGRYNTAPTNLAVYDNSSVVSATQHIAAFSLSWSGDTSSASGDNPTETTLFAQIRVKFTGAATPKERVLITRSKLSPSHPLVSSLNRNFKGKSSSSSYTAAQMHMINTLQDQNPTMTTIAQVGVVKADIGLGDNNNNNSGNNSSVVSTMNLSIIAVASVGAMIAVLSVLAVVVMKKRKNLQHQLDSNVSINLEVTNGGGSGSSSSSSSL